jgi:small GTP-binding protein
MDLKNTFTDKSRQTVVVEDLAPKPSETQSGKDNTYKILVCGEDSVGKSSLLQKLCGMEFPMDYKPTVGVDVFTKAISLPGDVNVTLRLWDTSGTSITSPMFPKHVHGVDAVIFVYDITSIPSYQAIERWVAAVQTHTKGRERGKAPVFALLGNKMDMTHLRAVKPHQHAALVDKYQMLSFLISARLGDLIGVVFRRIASQVAGVPLTRVELEKASAVIPAVIVDHQKNDPAQPQVALSNSKVCAIQ